MSLCKYNVKRLNLFKNTQQIYTFAKEEGNSRSTYICIQEVLLSIIYLTLYFLSLLATFSNHIVLKHQIMCT